MDDKRAKTLKALAKEFDSRKWRRIGYRDFPCERACQTVETLHRELKKLRAVLTETDAGHRAETAALVSELEALKSVERDDEQGVERPAEADGTGRTLRPAGRPGKVFKVGTWSVQKSGGYYRLFKRIGGKVRGIYLGKSFDPVKAREKIAAKLAEWGAPGPS